MSGRFPCVSYKCTTKNHIFTSKNVLLIWWFRKEFYFIGLWNIRGVGFSSERLARKYFVQRTQKWCKLSDNLLNKNDNRHIIKVYTSYGSSMALLFRPKNLPMISIIWYILLIYCIINFNKTTSWCMKFANTAKTKCITRYRGLYSFFLQ